MNTEAKGTSTGVWAAAVIAVLVLAGAGGFFGGIASTATNTKTTALELTSTVTISQPMQTMTAPPVTSSITQTITQPITSVTLTSTVVAFNAAGATIQSGTGITLLAGKDKGFYDSNGLAPSWSGTQPLASTFKNFIGNGTLIGLANAQDILVARANGVPVKMIASVGGLAPGFIVVNATSSFKTLANLDGKKIALGSTSLAAISSIDRITLYMVNKTAIHPTYVYFGGNATLQLAAMKGGLIDAISTNDPGLYSLALSGTLRVVAYDRDFLPQPWASGAIWATDSLIQQNPALVKAFVNANLQAVSYLVQNPSYESNLWSQSFGLSPAAAAGAVGLFPLTPKGQGSGNDLAAAANNIWQLGKVTGSIPGGATLDVASAVNTSFLSG